MIDQNLFFRSLPSSIFPEAITISQQQGIEAILDEWDRRRLPDLRWLAYILATVHRETGAKYQPITESLNYSVYGLLSNFGRHRISEADARLLGRQGGLPAEQEAIGNIIYGGEFGRAQLGNTQPGDGYRFRGRGLSQITGRYLYTLFGNRLGIDLVGHPELALDMATSVTIMFDGMVDGLLTGKALNNYFNATDENWREARRTVNAMDRADEIAATGRAYFAVLKLANRVAPDVPPVETVPPKPRFIEIIIGFFWRLFGGRA